MSLLDETTSMYETIRGMYPVFYYDIYEMQAILRAIGSALDTFRENAKKVFDDYFIDTMSESVIDSQIAYFNIPVQEGASLEFKRGILKEHFGGVGSLSEKSIKNLIYQYTGADAEIAWVGDVLSISVIGTSSQASDNEAMLTALGNRMPAHLQYQFANSEQILGNEYYTTITELVDSITMLAEES